MVFGWRLVVCGVLRCCFAPSGGREQAGPPAAQPADLVISDIFMPETDGIDTIVRLHEEFPDAKVVAITGGAYGFDKQQMLRTAALLGAVQTLLKPIQRSDLLDVVRDVLDEQA